MWNFVILLIKINNLWKLAVKIIITKWMFNRNTSFYRSTYEAIKHTYKLDTKGAGRRRPPSYAVLYTILYSPAASDGRLTRNVIIIIKCGFSWRAAATSPREKTLYNQITSNTIYVCSLRYVIAQCSDEAKLTM